MSNTSPNHVPYAEPSTPRGAGLWRGLFGWFLFGALTVTLFLLLNSREGSWTRITLSEFRSYVEEGEVRSVGIGEDVVRGWFVAPQQIGGKSTQRFRADLPKGMGSDWALVEWLGRTSPTTEIVADNESSLLMELLVPVFPWVLFMGFIWFFVFRQLRKGAQAGPAAPTRVTLVNPDGSPVVLSTGEAEHVVAAKAPPQARAGEGAGPGTP